MSQACWSRVRGGGDFVGRPALFLDRDGVLVEEVGYLSRVEDLRIATGAAALVGAANRARIAVVLVTNQSGVARGYFGWPEFEAIQSEIDVRLALEGARLDAVFACGAHASGEGELGVADHPWRKPNPGMLLAAGERIGVVLARSAMVGDRAQDLEAARAAGLRLGVHVATGHGASPDEQGAARALASPDFEVRAVPDLSALLDLPASLGKASGP